MAPGKSPSLFQTKGRFLIYKWTLTAKSIWRKLLRVGHHVDKATRTVQFLGEGCGLDASDLALLEEDSSHAVPGKLGETQMLRLRHPIQFPHFINKETEGQRQEVTFLWFAQMVWNTKTLPFLLFSSHTLGFQSHWELSFVGCQKGSYGTLHGRYCHPFCLLYFCFNCWVNM